MNPRAQRQRGSVLILVMWIAFGLVSIALYFGQSMALELRAADNRVASLEAEQAIDGMARYISYVLSNQLTNGVPPDANIYQFENVRIGNATCWLLGRTNQPVAVYKPFFALMDEAAKINLNTANTNVLLNLPNMTPELAAAMMDWRTTNTSPSAGGAKDETYGRLTPPYKCKKANYESVDELRLVYGMTLDLLYGEDRNFNGALDDNENDGSASLPMDNHDGHLDSGFAEYFTVFSREPNTLTNGSPRIDINTARTNLIQLLAQTFSAKRANEIMRLLPPANTSAGRFTSLMQFYLTSRMTLDEFAQIADQITTTTGQFIAGLINVNTASETVLACLPGIGTSNAPTLISYRLSNPDKLTSIAWVADALQNRASALQVGRFITTHSYQFTADVAAVGHQGRGYRRVRFVFDTSEGVPRIRYRQDLTHLGWALGKEVRQSLQLANDTR